MVKETFSNVIEKYGFLTGDPHFHDGGTSKRTGKAYAAFAYMFYLPINREETVRIDIDTDYFSEIASATEKMHQTQRIKIIGTEDSTGRFLATEVVPFDN